MFVGYVSNEQYEALEDVVVEFRREGEQVAVARSAASGAIHADVEAGTYEVVLQREGYGGKRVEVALSEDERQDFRLQSIDLLGYIWPQWVRAGESAEYHVHSPEETRISLWRYGEECEFVRLFDWHDEHGPSTCLQRLPDDDFTQTGVEWNEAGYEYVNPGTVTAPEESGLYYFHLETPAGRHFSFPWIVAPAEPGPADRTDGLADVAVLASTNTWNAYNYYGGRSNYVSADGLPDTPVVHSRTELDRFRNENGVYGPADEEFLPLSFERPCPFNSIPLDTEVTDPIRGKEGSHTAPAEWRFLGWLEREAYEYDLYADHQLHDGTLDLDAYEVLIVQTHPEYWSARMVDSVKAWVTEDGGKLMYLGGNGLNCEVEVLDESRIRFLNNADDVRMDVEVPEAAPENSYESRMHRSKGESEGSLLGVTFTESGIKRAAPYEVRDPDHWVFEGTDLAEGELFGEETLQERCPGGASGHETDKRSRYRPENTELIAKGTNADRGGGEIVHYETDSGGAVFSVGSITYPLALLVDEEMSTMTKNVIDRFTGT